MSRNSRDTRAIQHSGKEEIQYNVTSSPLGRLLVAGTSRGIAAVYLGNSDVELRKELHQDYPAAQLRHNPPAVRHWERALIEQLRGHGQPRAAASRLPLDVHGTAFQQRVWDELQKIPYGAHCSYSEISKRIGRPSAVRAVASAIARNPVSILIPCHRVVRQSGELGGYRWGVQRKRKLLEFEELNRGKKAARIG